jgi:rubrerythrin
MSKTENDLKAAFAGESQANRKYLAFAKKADDEGFKQAARLFRAAAHAETIHALAHFRAMGGVGTTQQNLTAAVAGENYEVTTMYPEFIKDAQDEDVKPALLSFNRAWEVEKGHEQLYSAMLIDLKEGEAEYEFYVCPVCGYVHARNAPGSCPVCGAPGERFEKIV